MKNNTFFRREIKKLSISVISNFPSGGGNNLKPKILSARYKEIEINTSLCWYQVAYGNGVFVATGTEYVDGNLKTSNKYIYSYDGENWTEGTLPANGYYYCVCFIKDRFYILNNVAANNYVSKDGIHWTTYHPNKIGSGAVAAVLKIAYGNGVFVAIGASTSSKGYIAYSYDTTKEWNIISTPIKEQVLNDIIYGNGMFIATASKTNQYLYSYDGKRWYEGTLDIESTYINGSYITYGNGKFVINVQITTDVSVETQENICFVSEDGLIWKKITLYSTTYGSTNTPLRFTYINYINGMFFMTSNAWYYTYSYDGENWKTSECYYGVVRTNTVFGNGIFVNFRNSSSATSMNKVYVLDVSIPPEEAVYLGNASDNDKLLNEYSTSVKSGYGTSGNVERIKPQLSKWQAMDISTITGGKSWSSVAYGNGIYVAIHYGESTDTYSYSYDGFQWENGTFTTAKKRTAIVFGNGIFVIFGDNKFEYSYDGINWTIATFPETYPVSYCCYGNGIFIVGISNFTSFYYSYSGTGGWKKTVLNTSGYVQAAYGENRFIVCNSSLNNVAILTYNIIDDVKSVNYILISLIGTVSNYNNIVYGNGMFIAVSFEDTDIYNYSIDGGKNWNIGKFPFTFKAVSICYGNGIFLVTIENNKTYLYSYDGLEWESGELEELYSYSKILFLNDMFMICNNSHIHDSYGSYSKYQFATISSVPKTEKFLGGASEDDILEGASGTSIEGYNITGKAKRIYSGTVISRDITKNFRSIVNATDIVYDDIQQKLFVYVCDDVLENNAAGTNSWKSVSTGTLNLPSIVLTYLNSNYRLINNYVAYHNGKYIIIRSQGSVFKSTDGTSWSSITNISPSYVRMVKWLNDRFVIIARSKFYYSIDGSTFTESNRSSLKETNGDWVDVAYGNGVYVAIFYQTDSSNATIAYSTDHCATWTQKSLSSTGKLRCITYGLGMFVAIPETGQNYYTSVNGIDWTIRSSLPSTSSGIQNNYIAFISSAESSTIGNMFIIAKGQEDNVNSYNPTSTYYTSTDGINWTSRNFPISGQCNSIRLCGSKLYALFYRSNVICFSSNGTSWNTQNLNTFERIVSIAYGNGKLLALTRFGGISTSTDGGNSWNVSKLPWFNCFLVGYRAIIFGNGIFSVIGHYSNSGHPANCSFWTEDGVHFTKINGNYTSYFNYFLNGMFFYTSNGIDFLYSIDGKTIQSNKFPASFSVSSSQIRMAYGNGRYVAISADMKKIAYSADGIVWMAVNALPIVKYSVSIGNVTYGNLVFVACLNDKELLYSTNGIGWSIRENTTGSGMAIFFLNGVFFNGTHYSTNGIDWIPQRYTSTRISTNLYTIMGNNIINYTSINLYKNTFTLPPLDAQYLGDARENDIIEGHSATSINGYGIEGKAEKGMPYPIGVEDITGNIEYTACDWADVAYGNGIYIAVAKQDNTLYISKSSNGTTWNAVQKVANYTYRYTHICFGNGKFVLYCENERTNIYTTTNGESWTRIKVPVIYGQFGTVKYINNKFVLVGDTVIYYSDDGENWTQSSMAGLEVTNYWRDIAYGNGKYVMIRSSSASYAMIATSTDLENWTQISIGTTYLLENIEYGNGKFVIITNVRTIIYSTDGENWTTSATALDTSINPQTICYGNNLFIIAGGNSNRNTDIYYTSTDGISWTKRYFGINGLYQSIKYLNNKYYAVANGSTKILVSSNGTSWSSYILKNRTGSMLEIAYGNGILLVQGIYSDYFRSTDMGKTWTRYEFATYFVKDISLYKHLVYGNGVFSLVYNNIQKYYSRDGITFTKITSAVNNIGNILFYNNLFFYFYNGKATYYYTSSDGITITQRTAPFDINFEDTICYGNGKYVLWKRNGTNAAYSTDGINWTLITLPTFTAGVTINIYNVAYGNGLFIGIANAKDMIISYDGINWSVIKNPINSNGVIDFINGIFVYGSYYYSYNGFDWIKTNLFHTSNYKSTKIGENYLSLDKGNHTVIIKAPPKDAYYLGNARPEDIPKGITFSSIHGYGLIGTKE